MAARAENYPTQSTLQHSDGSYKTKQKPLCRVLWEHKGSSYAGESWKASRGAGGILEGWRGKKWEGTSSGRTCMSKGPEMSLACLLVWKKPELQKVRLEKVWGGTNGL